MYNKIDPKLSDSYDLFQIVVPSSLRTIQPFLDDSQKYIRYIRGKSGTGIIKYKRIALSCINAAFKLNIMLNSEINEKEAECLQSFFSIRNTLARELEMTELEITNLVPYTKHDSEEIGTHELLVAEADAVLALADEQIKLDLKHDAMLSYHTSCVFYRVMETMIPSKISSMQHSKLVYAADQVRKCSTLFQNLVHENFVGGSCSESYEVHGSNKLGKGSYGSVYLATHRVTADERAVKVMNVDRITSYYLRKLHTEIAILKSLDHPNIIKLQDVFFGKRSGRNNVLALFICILHNRYDYFIDSKYFIFHYYKSIFSS